MPNIIRKTKRFDFFERNAHFSERNVPLRGIPHFKNFSTGSRQYYIKTALELHSNAVRFFALSLRSALRDFDNRLVRCHASRHHDFAAEGETRPDARARKR